MKEIGNVFFIASALNYGFHTYAGVRHHEIFKYLKEKNDEFLTTERIRNMRQGFLVEEDGVIKFITREEATEIAKNNNFPMIGSILTSEDLW